MFTDFFEVLGKLIINKFSLMMCIGVVLGWFFGHINCEVSEKNRKRKYKKEIEYEEIIHEQKKKLIEQEIEYELEKAKLIEEISKLNLSVTEFKEAHNFVVTQYNELVEFYKNLNLK